MYKSIQHIIGTYCDKNPIIFELGAMNGDFSSKYYNMVKDKPKHYFAFEPNPVNIKKITSNSTFPKNAILVQKAIGNYTGKMKFYQSHGHTKDKPYNEYEGCSSLRKPKVVKTKFPFLYFTEIEVGVTKLDDFCNKFGVKNIDIILADLQGEERGMIEGGTEILKKTKFMVLEKSDTEELYEGQWLTADYLKNLPDWKIYKNFNCDIILYNTKIVKL